MSGAQHAHFARGVSHHTALTGTFVVVGGCRPAGRASRSEHERDSPEDEHIEEEDEAHLERVHLLEPQAALAQERTERERETSREPPCGARCRGRGGGSARASTKGGRVAGEQGRVRVGRRGGRRVDTIWWSATEC